MNQKRIEKLIKVMGKEIVLVLMGQSGSSKGTQLTLLLKTFKTLKIKPFAIGMGELFRTKTKNYSDLNKQKLKAIQDEGKAQSYVNAIALWSHELLYNYEKGPIIFDGSPRSVPEADAMIEFLVNYLGKTVIFIHLKVSDKEARARIIQRNLDDIANNREPRTDTDTPEKITEKLKFYHTQVKPAIKRVTSASVFNAHVHLIEIETDSVSKPDVHNDLVIKISEIVL